MAENGDAEDIAKDNFPTENEIPFRIDSKYTPEELSHIGIFMHEDFPHTTYGGGRDKEVIIENVPERICDSEKWKKILDTVLLPELDEMNPKIKRNTKIIVRFEDKLHDYSIGADVSGLSLIRKGLGLDEVWVRVKNTNKYDKDRTTADLTLVMMHELAEVDFWSKTPADDQEANVELSNEIDMLLNSSKDYWQLLDEKIANRRAFRAVQRMWPNAKYLDPEDIYEEDKQV